MAKYVALGNLVSGKLTCTKGQIVDIDDKVAATFVSVGILRPLDSAAPSPGAAPVESPVAEPQSEDTAELPSDTQEAPSDKKKSKKGKRW